MTTIQSPHGLALLMGNLWLRHRAGQEPSSDNVYVVDLPPLSEEEKSKLREDTVDNQVYSQDELYGVWI